MGLGLGQHALAAALIGLAFLTEAAATFVFWRRSRLARWAGPPRV